LNDDTKMDLEIQTHNRVLEKMYKFHLINTVMVQVPSHGEMMR